MKNITKQIFSNLNKDLVWIEKHTCFLTIHGSIAYGLNTPESDIDVRGVCSTPKEYLLGFNKNFEQYITKEPDCTIFNIKKFFALTCQNNPNTLELLFVEPEHHIFVNEIGKVLLDNRDRFLSKLVKERYIGYSKAQAHRIRQHRSWLLHPIEAMPLRKDFGLSEKISIEKNQFDAVKSLIQKKLESWIPDFEPFSDSQKIYLQNKVSDILSEVNIYADDKYAAAARSIGLDENLIQIIKKEKEFENKVQEHKNYLSWKENRNPKRAMQEAVVGYDCFSDDTEFLTDSGFKNYNNITGKDKLATVFLNNDNVKHRKTFGVEYQNYTERFESLFSGNIYNFYGNHLDVLVTPNHRMLFRDFSIDLNRAYEWKLEEAHKVSSRFDFLRTIAPNKKNYSDGNLFNNLPISSKQYMLLMGAFLSDGSFAFNGDMPDVITISQKAGNRLHKWMNSFYNRNKDKIQVSLYKYKRETNNFRKNEMQEVILSIRDKAIINKLYADCGHHKEKHIPRWVFSLSKRLMSALFHNMHLGDGTVRNTNFKSLIYYTSVKQLADDTQELALLCGWETSLYGPYEYIKNDKPSIIYHVHINKNTEMYDRLTKNHNLKKIPVINQRVVCFSVPNGTLVIRRNGHISIQGNCKHATQLVRLLKLGKEILETGKVQVKITDDREKLMEIKTGKWSYEKLIESTDKMELEVKESYKNSKLPNQPDVKYLDNLCIELIERNL